MRLEKIKMVDENLQGRPRTRTIENKIVTKMAYRIKEKADEK
jgi:hypothetical protein